MEGREALEELRTATVKEFFDTGSSAAPKGEEAKATKRKIA